jgi:flagellar motility protein MotE (MotC chaperone)
LAAGVPWFAVSVQNIGSVSAGQSETVPESAHEVPSTRDSDNRVRMSKRDGMKVVEPQDLRVQGPAVDVPREVLNLLDQRKRHLDRREDTLRAEMERLENVKSDLEDLLSRYEGAVKAFEEQQQRTHQAKEDRDRKRREGQAAAVQAKLDVVAKMYEGMPAEEAAVRIEKMPASMAVQVLRTVKSKTAGAILAQVRPDKAAKLTEQIVNAAAASAVPSKATR